SYIASDGTNEGATPTGWLSLDNVSGDPAFTESISGSAAYDDGTVGAVGYLGCSDQSSTNVEYNNDCHYGFKENDCTGGDGTQRACWDYWYPEYATLKLKMSVSADNPIGIDFSGSAAGSIVIDSDAPVELADQIINPNGSLTINAVGAITAGAKGAITSSSVSLSTGGVGGIGSIASPLPVTITSMQATPTTPGSISALADADGIYLAVSGDASLGTVSAQDASGGGYGDIVIDSTGSLLAGATASANVTGANITLLVAGDAGSQAAPLVLAAHQTPLPNGGEGNGIVNVVAGGQVGIEQTAGDLMIGRTVCGAALCQTADQAVQSPDFGIVSTGDKSVYVDVTNGGIFDASGQTAVSALSDTQLQALWSRLGLVAGTPADVNAAKTLQVQTFAAQVKRFYDQYWRLILNGSVSADGTQYALDPGSQALYEPAASAALGGAVPSAQQIDDYAQYLWTQTTAFFDNVPVAANAEFGAPLLPAPLQYTTTDASGTPSVVNLGPILGADWRTNAYFDPTQSAGPTAGFAFSATTIGQTAYDADVQALTQNEYWTPDELRYAVDDAALGAPMVGTAAHPDVSGGALTLVASGDIGRQIAPTSISIAELTQGLICSATLTSGCVTSDQLAALALATAPGDITVGGTFAGGGTFSGYQLANVPVGASLTTLSVAETAPLFISALGLFSSNSGGKLFAQSTIPTLTVGTVVAGSDAHLVSPGSILGGPLASVKTGGALTLNAVGDIAQSVDPTVTPLTIAAAELASVRAGGQVDLIDRAGDLVIDTGAVLAAGGPAQLTATAGSIVQQLVGCDPSAGACVAVTGDGIVLNAGDQIGSATTLLGVSLSGGALTATAPKGIYLET
ncbi:MAG: hypothetical protein ACRDNS_21415, partial [Trebonia sp.]